MNCRMCSMREVNVRTTQANILGENSVFMMSLGLVVLHEGEYRQWHSSWGEAPEERGHEDWQQLNRGIKADHWVWRHPQLQMTPMTSKRPPDLQSARQMASGINLTILRKAGRQPLADAYEARNVFITSLPEVLLLHMYRRTAKELYEE